MSDLARSFNRHSDPSIGRLEVRIAALEEIARLAHEDKMRSLQEETHRHVEATGFYKGIMATTTVGVVIVAIVLAITRS
jgi:hypothetical protein